jgi:uncharacterized integral membrane protein
VVTATRHRLDPPGRGATTTKPGDDSGQPGGHRPGARGTVPRSRIGGVWVALIVAAVVFLLLIFILQNGQRAQLSFLGAHGHLPMGVALLLAAVFGVLLVALPGTARIIQLRMLARRRGRAVELPLPPPGGPGDPGGL